MHICIAQKVIDTDFFPDKCEHCREVFFKKENIIGLSLPSKAIVCKCPYLGRTNTIIYFSASKIFFPKHEGVFSLKAAYGGNEVYETDKAKYSVNKDNFLILNNQEQYASYIDSKTPVESFALFFSNSFIKDVFRAFKYSPRKLLDDPYKEIKNPITFHKQLQSKNTTLSKLLSNLRKVLNDKNNIDPNYIEETFYRIMQIIIINNLGYHDKIDNINKIKASTRIEIMSRLIVAKNFIDCNFEKNISLLQISNESYLSSYHLLRHFKEAFNTTPRQYIINKRIEKAKNLLKKSKKSIMEIAYDIGFESPSYFTSIFKRKLGISPRNFRKYQT